MPAKDAVLLFDAGAATVRLFYSFRITKLMTVNRCKVAEYPKRIAM